MSRYAHILDRPPAYKLVEKWVDVLSENVSLLVKLGGQNVFAHEAAADKPSSGKWVVVRERVDIGGRAELASGFTLPAVQVMVESRKSLHTPEEARQFHAETHAIITEALVGVSVTIQDMDVNFAKQESSGIVAYDVDDDTRYSTATFRATLSPVTT